MRLTIERMRMLVLAAAVLLVAALAIVLAIGKWRNPFNRRDIPQRLGVEIQQEASGVTYTEARGGRTLFKIHASRVVQLKSGHAQLHGVEIDLYSAGGTTIDRIMGEEFEYDQQNGTASAAGPVEITLMRPGVAPVAPTLPAGAPKPPKISTAQAGRAIAPGSPLTGAAEAARETSIHVETSGITFDQKTNLVTTARRLNFSTGQGSGTAIGASWNSDKGLLVLDHAVHITTHRGPETVVIHADHAEFDRDARRCRLRAATADYRDSHAAADQATILFRDDGSVVRFDATSGFTLLTATGSRMAAPAAQFEFNEHSQPQQGRLEGGVSMDSVTALRTLHADSPTALIEFTAQGQLRHVHLERGVEMRSNEITRTSAAGSQSLRLTRTWRSPVAEIDFRNSARGQVELASIHGPEGAVLTGESRRGTEPAEPSRLAADDLVAAFGPGSTLQSMNGTGHASIEQTTATGLQQTATGDYLQARFVPVAAAKSAGAGAPSPIAATQIDTAQLDGNVVLVQQPAASQPPPASKASAAPQALETQQAPLRATAGHAVYEGRGEWLHLTGNPSIRNGGLEISAVKIDLSQQSGNAYAHGNVKATWLDPNSSTRPTAQQASQASASSAGPNEISLGGQGPVHVVASEAELHQATNRAIFRGQARLWQQSNSIGAPEIVLDRRQQSLTAQTQNSADPVRVVLLSAESLTPRSAQPSAASSAPAAPSVIRIRGGDLWYSAAERRALMRSGVLNAVTSQTPTAGAVSDQVEITLLPAVRQAAASAVSAASSQAQVDQLTARGHVVLTSQNRRGTGSQLVYTGATGDYVLTGTATAPPRISDSVRGAVSGQTLIFHSRDDSVSIEGGGRPTTVETTAPR